MAVYHVTRWVPLIIILVLLTLFFYLGLHHFFTFATLAQHEKNLEHWTHHYYLELLLVYMLVYIVLVAISVPGMAIIFTLLGGFLFGIFPGVLYAIVSATIGATLLFLAVRTSIGYYLAKKVSGWLSRLEVGFQKNAWNYLLFLRLVPIFPFWVVNIIPALLNVRLSAFVSATFLGMIPGTLIYTIIGRDLDKLLSAGREPNVNIIFEPTIFWPIIFLAILSLLPVIYRQFKHAD